MTELGGAADRDHVRMRVVCDPLEPVGSVALQMQEAELDAELSGRALGLRPELGGLLVAGAVHGGRVRAGIEARDRGARAEALLGAAADVDRDHAAIETLRLAARPRERAPGWLGPVDADDERRAAHGAAAGGRGPERKLQWCSVAHAAAHDVMQRNESGQTALACSRSGWTWAGLRPSGPAAGCRTITCAAAPGATWPTI